MREAREIVGTAGGAVGLSALALALGACCVSPWAVTLLGVGGAVFLARLTVAQPYVVAATFPLIGVGLWLAYRRTSGANSCHTPARTRLRWFVWIAAAAVVAMDAASLVPRFFG